MLDVAGVSVHYRDALVPAVRDVSLTVERGEVVCILGPSGSGKTSLLRAIAGLERPAAGRVTWDGQDLTFVAPHLRGFSMVFQDFALFPHLDVFRNVLFGLRMRRVEHDLARRRVDEVLAFVGLSGYADRAVATLSGGEMQRVALARALAPRPALLLMDEPLGSLDRPLRERLTTELRDILHQADAGVMYVTHDQQEAFALADRVAVFDRGRIVQLDAPQTVWRRPASAFVARFLGIANVFALGEATDMGLPVPAGLDARPDRWLVIPPDAMVLTLEAEGQLRGTVAQASLRGAYAEVRVDIGGPLHVVVACPASRAPVAGTRVGVLVDAELVSVVSD